MRIQDRTGVESKRVGILHFHSFTYNRIILQSIRDMLRCGGLCYSELLRGGSVSHYHTWVVTATPESSGTEANIILDSSQ